MKSFLKVLIFLLILLVGIIGIGVYWTFYKPLPDYSAHLTIAGLHDPVTIKWDKYGVPHITAQNKHDLYFAVGYVHAQDRLWQMTLIQLAEEGRFSEFFGKKMVPYDKYLRTLGFMQIAKKIRATMPDSEVSALQDYANGVNAYVRDNKNKLPIEFSLTGMKPIPWTVDNSIAFERMLAWQLNVCWWSKATYNYLAGVLKPAKLDSLFPTYPETAPTSLNSAQTRALSASVLPMVKRDFALRRIMDMRGTHVGSNAWVVDGSMTKSGFPMLAGDPHLGLQIPGDWYEVVWNLNGRHVSGATHPGAPFIILGQNDFLAWSLTNIMADDTDFFVEQVDPDDRGRYVVDSLKTARDTTVEYARFKYRRELIKVKGGQDVPFEIRYTKHGPVISDIFQDKHLIGNKVVAMDWTGYDVSDEIRTFMKIDWANSFEQFRNALKSFGVPGQNFMYADKTGNIAMFSVGKIPIRKHNPILFRKGWDPSYNWEGFIPFNKMPHVINPKDGWIANANNKLTPANYPYYISSFWEPPSRIENIVDHLKGRKNLTVEDFMKLQNSSFSVHAEQDTKEILPVLEPDSTNASIKKALTYLKNWDYKYNTSETAASIFDVFYLKLARNTLEDEMGKDAYNNFIRLENLPVRVMDRFLRTNSSFFDNVNTEPVETRRDIILKSMKQAIQFLSDSLGTKSYKWQWGNIHTITFKPPLLSKAAESPDASDALKLIVKNILSRGPYPVKGDGLTVDNGQYSWRHPYAMVLGPSIRRIVDFSNLNYTYSVIPTGQSGNPLSKHYDDQTDMWLEGKYRKLSQDPVLTESQPHQTMILKPAS